MRESHYHAYDRGLSFATGPRPLVRAWCVERLARRPGVTALTGADVLHWVQDMDSEVERLYSANYGGDEDYTDTGMLISMSPWVSVPTWRIEA